MIKKNKPSIKVKLKEVTWTTSDKKPLKKLTKSLTWASTTK